TNTYLIGKGPRKVLLDTGEGVSEYIPLLQSALKKDLGDATISKVICSHWHHDHVGGIPEVMKFLASRNIQLNDLTAEEGATLPIVYKFPDPEHDDPETQFEGLQDQQEFKVDDQTTLVTLHTPGHTSDHCSFWLKEENTLFTADCVLGQGSAVFEDLSKYMKSLEKQLTLGQASGEGQQQEPAFKIYPGHGPVVEDGPAKIREYINHRLERERDILKVLSNPIPKSDGDNDYTSTDANADTTTTTTSLEVAGIGKTALQIVSVIYKVYPVYLHAAAEHQVLLHLKKLEQDGKVRRAGGLDTTIELSDVVWEPVQQ
ncbi:hypothetical protein BX616_005914, partial [Lobosporangium transversale]